MLDCALTVPASRLGKRQPFLPLRGDPALHGLVPDMSAHINLSTALLHVRMLRPRAET